MAQHEPLSGEDFSAVLDARRRAIQEYAACGGCTANRGEECRNTDGSPYEDGVHPERVDRFLRETGLEPAAVPAPEQESAPADAEPTPKGGTK